MTEWKAGDLAEIDGRLVQVMYPPSDGKVLVRDIDASYRKMSMAELWAFGSAGDSNAVAEIRYRSFPGLPVPLPGFFVSYVATEALRIATVEGRNR